MPNTLGDLNEAGLISIRTGPFGSALHAHEYVDAGVSVIPTEAIVDGSVSREKLVFVSSDKAKELDRYRLRPGDIVFARRGAQACGISALIKPDLPEAIAGTGIIALRINDASAIYPEFLSYLVGADESVAWLKHHAIGATMPNLNSSIILSLPASIPGMADQKAIAHILGTLDDKIELNRQMNATLEAMAQALFKSWFVDFDPVIDNALAAGNPIPEPLQPRAEARAALGDQRKPLPEAIQKQFPNRFVFSEDMGWVPEGWEVRTLDQVTTELRRGVSPKYVEEGGVRVINQKCIRDHWLNYDFTRRHDPAERKIDGREIKVGDVLVNSTGVGTLGRMAQVFDLEETTVVDSHVTVIRPDTTIYPPLVFGQFMLSMEPTVEAMGEGTTGQTELSRANLQALNVLVPPLASQGFLEQRLAAYANRRVSASGENNSLAKLRDTLLPKLLSGQLRIPDAEKQLAEAL